MKVVGLLRASVCMYRAPEVDFSPSYAIYGKVRPSIALLVSTVIRSGVCTIYLDIYKLVTALCRGFKYLSKDLQES